MRTSNPALNFITPEVLCTNSPSSAFGYSSISFLRRIIISSDSWSSRETWLKSASVMSTSTFSNILLGSFYLMLLREAITLLRLTNSFTSFTSYFPSILQSIKIYFFFNFPPHIRFREFSALILKERKEC